MARVNRTTGFFLVLGVLALLGTAAGARWMLDPGEATDKAEAPAGESRVFASGNVDTASGLSVLVPTRPGRIVAVNVKEGDVVKKGQILVQLDDKVERDALAIAEKGLDVAKARLNNARQAIQAHELKVVEQKRIVSLADTAVKLAESSLEQADRLAKSGLDASAELKLKHARIGLDGARKDKSAAEEGLQKLQAIDPALSLQEHEEAIKKAELEVKAAHSALDLYAIKAPSDGQVFEINYQVGGSAPLPLGDANASRALVFCPNDALIVRAEIDQEWALMVKPGMKATLTYRAAGRDYTWTGQVEKVSNYIQRRRSRTMDPDTFNDARTRECIIRVNPDPKNELIHGMRMGVQIHTSQTAPRP